jgi:methyl-accepting chemotaxis protein
MKNIIELFRQKLEFKILALIILILLMSFGTIYYFVSSQERKDLIEKEREKAAFIAGTVHMTLDKDMMAFRADLVRFLMDDIKQMPGIIRLQIVRGDGPYLGEGRGREVAFQDFKTLDDVHQRIKGLYRPEWEVNHSTETAIAEGSDNPGFQEYFEKMIVKLNQPNALSKGEKAIRDEGSEDYSYFEEVNGVETITYLRPLPNFPKCALCHSVDHKLRGILMITTSMEGVNIQVQKSQRLLLTGSLLTVLIVALLLGFMIRRVALRPLTEVVERVKDIAEGGGDLTRRIHVGYKDEIGSVAYWVNVFMEKLHHVVSQVSKTSQQVSATSQEILEGTQGISDGTTVQANAVKATSDASEEMNASIKEIADRTESLSGLTQESAAATLQMSVSIDEIANSAASLSSLVEDSTGSILELSSAIKQIDENAESLANSASETATSMVQMDASIKQIRSNVHGTVEISKGVADDADRGLQAVEQTGSWINQVQQNSQQIETVLRKLKTRTENIGKILKVIDEVADQTNLLALNAAIIAAQAGEHGKGFSVVAQEIKELADRTALSTHEIHNIINELQDESNNVVETIQRGSRSIEEGVRLSREATEALNKIHDSSLESTEKIQEIAVTTDEQTVSIRRVTEAMQTVNGMAQDIRNATREQSKGSGAIIAATDKIRDIAVKVKAATQEQSLGNKQIRDIVDRVNRMVKDISLTTGKQTREGESIVKAIERIHTVVLQNTEVIGTLSSAVRKLLEQARLLSAEIEKFKV